MAIRNDHKVKQLYPDAVEVKYGRLVYIFSKRYKEYQPDSFGRLSCGYFESKDAWSNAAKRI